MQNVFIKDTTFDGFHCSVRTSMQIGSGLQSLLTSCIVFRMYEDLLAMDIPLFPHIDVQQTTEITAQSVLQARLKRRRGRLVKQAGSFL